MRIIFVMAAALLLAGCQPQAGRVNLEADEKIQISQAVWDHYQEYLRDVGSARGAFTVTADGRTSNYSYCPVTNGCWSQINYSHEAIKSCQQDGMECVVFARNSTIVVDYEVID